MKHARIAVVILALGLAASIVLSALAAPRDPVPLRGAPLGNETGLRLLVAGNPPFVLDVDTGEVIPSGIPATSPGTLRVVGVGGQAAAVIARADLYAVRGRGALVAPLGIGTNVWPARHERSVWVQSTAARSRCTLRRMGLDGRQLRAARPFPCATVNDPSGGSLGVVVGRTRVFDPRTADLVLQTRRGIWAVAGTKLVLAGPDDFTLLDGTTRLARRLPWPSILPFLDRPAVDPRSRFVALAFAVPSWRGGGSQVLDVWILNTKTGTLSQLPGMPAFVSLKGTDIEWTDDGRLVLLGVSNGKDVVAVWRPGERRLFLKTVAIPERNSGSDSFAILR